MKIRSGFVSNSSSSSFIVAYKDNFMEEYKKEFSVNETRSGFPKITYDIGESFKRNISEEYTSLEDFINDVDWFRDEVKERFTKLLAQGYKVAVGSVSDESDYDKIDKYLCHTEFDYSSDNISIYKEESY